MILVLNVVRLIRLIVVKGYVQNVTLVDAEK